LHEESVTTRTTRTAPGALAPGHLGELTQVIDFALVDAVLDETRTRQRRRRLLPSRVVVYFVRARRRIGAAPLRLLFDTLAGPVGPRGQAGVFYRGLRTVAIDGTHLGCVPTPRMRPATTPTRWARPTGVARSAPCRKRSDRSCCRGAEHQRRAVRRRRATGPVSADLPARPGPLRGQEGVRRRRLRRVHGACRRRPGALVLDVLADTGTYVAGRAGS